MKVSKLAKQLYNHSTQYTRKGQFEKSLGIQNIHLNGYTGSWSDPSGIRNKNGYFYMMASTIIRDYPKKLNSLPKKLTVSRKESKGSKRQSKRGSKQETTTGAFGRETAPVPPTTTVSKKDPAAVLTRLDMYLLHIIDIGALRDEDIREYIRSYLPATNRKLIKNTTTKDLTDARIVVNHHHMNQKPRDIAKLIDRLSTSKTRRSMIQRALRNRIRQQTQSNARLDNINQQVLPRLTKLSQRPLLSKRVKEQLTKTIDILKKKDASNGVFASMYQRAKNFF